MRMRKKPWAAQEVQENPFVVLSPELHRGAWRTLFGNEHPIHVEIGMGKGSFILENARQNPGINYIGIEKQESVIAIAARKLAAEEEIRNVRLVCGDGAGMATLFQDGEIQKIFINFCDPWPKRKWAKRRLTHHRFLRIYQALLAREGMLCFKTDNQDLFEFSLNELLEERWQVRNVSLDLHKRIRLFPETQNIMTEYETKFSEKGQPIYALTATNQL